MTTLDDFAAGHEDAARLLDAQRRQILELEATVAFLEAQNANLQTDLGAASFIAGERTRNSIVRWLRETIDRRQKPAFERDDGIRDVAYEIANAIANCEDIEVI